MAQNRTRNILDQLLQARASRSQMPHPEVLSQEELDLQGDLRNIEADLQSQQALEGMEANPGMAATAATTAPMATVAPAGRVTR